MGVEHITLGRGEIWFAPFIKGTTTMAEGYRFIGNCPEFSLNHSQETLDHYRSTRGLREKDKSVVIESNLDGTIVCDEILPETMAYFFNSKATKTAISAVTNGTYTINNPTPSRWYQIGESATDPVGVRNLTSISITGKEEGKDYAVNLQTGMIGIVAGGTITPSTPITVTYSAAAQAGTQIISSHDELEGALRFKSFNPSGPNYDYVMPYVKLTPNGDFNLITEQDWLTIPLSISVLTKGNLSKLYIDGRTLVA